MKENSAHWCALVSSPAAAPTRKTKFEEDAERVIEYYRDRGYITRAGRRARS